MEKATRKSNFELMRILCAIAIVFFHCANAIGLPEEVSKSRILFVSLGSWGCLGVDLFLLVSIYFMRNKETQMAKVKQILQTVLFYAVLLSVGRVIWENYPNFKGGGIARTLGDLLRTGLLQPFFTDMYWFISAYLFLYVAMPVLRKIYHDKEIYDKKYIWLQWGLMLCAIFISKVNLFSDFIFVILIYFIAVDMFERENNFFERYRVQGSIICTGIIILSRWILPMWDGLWILERITGNVSRYSIIIFLDALFLFYLFKNLNIGHHSIINKMSAMSLAIYLFHDNKLFSLRYIIVDAVKNYIDFEAISEKD